jgi:hypothetical protein
MSSPTDVESIRFLLSEINSLGPLMLGEDNAEQVRKKLILAAEKLIIAARTPGENLYLTAAQVGLLLPVQYYNADITKAFSQWINKCRLLYWML